MVPILLVVIICILCPPMGVAIGICLIGLALCMLICTLFEGLLSVLRVSAVQAIVLVAAAVLGWTYLYGPLLRAIT